MILKFCALFFHLSGKSRVILRSCYQSKNGIQCIKDGKGWKLPERKAKRRFIAMARFHAALRCPGELFMLYKISRRKAPNTQKSGFLCYTWEK